MDDFGFGIVYTDSGVADSEYMYALETHYPVQFSVNFQGIGLPSSVFDTVYELLGDVTDGNITCYTDLGYCVADGGCATYTYLSAYYFTFKFTSANSDNYMRVPITTFVTTEDSECTL